MVTEKPWHPLSVAQLLLGIFFCLMTGSLMLSLVGPDRLSQASAEVRPLIFLTNTLCFQGITILLVAFFLRHNQMRWREAFGFSPLRLGTNLGAGSVAFILFVPCGLFLQNLVLALISLVTQTDALIQAQEVVQILQKEISAQEQWIIGVSTIAIAPLAEEVLFRGILYPTVKQMGYPRAALWGVACLFGVIHNNLASALPLALFGVFLSLLYERTGSLLAPIFTHAAFNAMNFMMLIHHLNYNDLWLRLRNLLP